MVRAGELGGAGSGWLGLLCLSEAGEPGFDPVEDAQERKETGSHLVAG